MHFIKYLVAAFALTSTLIYAADHDEGIAVLNKEPYHTVSYTKGELSLQSIVRDKDEARLQTLIGHHKEYQQNLSPVKPYTLSSHTFYLNKAEERHSITGFYGVISQANVEESAEAYFALGALTTIYETKEKPQEHRLLNQLFFDLGMIHQKDGDAGFDKENMDVVDGKGLATVAYGFHPDLYNIPEKIKAYWDGLIACVKKLKNQGENLPYNPNGIGQDIPAYLTCIAAGYDVVMLNIMSECGFTLYTLDNPTYGLGIADFAPGANRVLAVLNLND